MYVGGNICSLRLVISIKLTQLFPFIESCVISQTDILVSTTFIESILPDIACELACIVYF